MIKFFIVSVSDIINIIKDFNFMAYNPDKEPDRKPNDSFSIIGDDGKLVTLHTIRKYVDVCDGCYFYNPHTKDIHCTDKDYKLGNCSSLIRDDKTGVIFVDDKGLKDIEQNHKLFGLKDSDKKRFKIEENGMKSFLAAALLGMSPMADIEAKGKPTSSATATTDKKTLEKRIQNVAKTIYTEAAGESYEGKRAVATVIYNRSKQSPWRGLTLSQICKQPKQFSGWNNGEPVIKINNPGDQKAWDDSLKIAKELVYGTFKPVASLGNSNQYYNPKKASPSWGNKMKDVVYVGNHKFGKV
jgi:hypothetical protein